MPRRGEHRAQPVVESHPRDFEAERRIGLRTIDGFTRSRPAQIRLDPSDFRCSRVAAQLADEAIDLMAETSLQFSSKANHFNSLRDFCRFLDGTAAHPERLAVGGSDDDEFIDLIDAWELSLRERLGDLSTRPQAQASGVLRLIGSILDRLGDSGRLAIRCSAGATFTSVASTPLDEFTSDERRAIETAAKRCIQRNSLRMAEGRARAAAGCDPDEGGWDNVDNLLHRTARRLLTEDELRAALGRRWQKLPPAIQAIVPSRSDGYYSLSRLRTYLERQLVLSELELMSYRVLLGLRLGLSPEELLFARVSAIEFTPEGVRLRTNKNRRGSAMTHRYREREEDADDNTVHLSSGRRFSAPQVLADLLDATSVVRSLSGEDDPGLWLTTNWHRVVPARFLTRTGLGAWLDAHGIDVAGPADMRRLRKTHKTIRAIALGGVVSDIADDQTVQVFNNSYAHTTTLMVASGRAINAAQQKIADKAATGPTVIADALTSSDRNAQSALALDQTQINDLLKGQLDVGLAACRDICASPFAPAGEICPVAPGRCLVCPNALILVSHLPRLLAFVRHLDSRKLELAPPAWEQMWGATYRNIIDGVLPQFTPEQVAKAEHDSMTIALDIPLGMRTEMRR